MGNSIKKIIGMLTGTKCVKVLIVGRNWDRDIPLIVSSLKRFWPKQIPVETRKNNQGVEAAWNVPKSHSCLIIMSSKQEVSCFFGAYYDAIFYNGFPSEEILRACKRSLSVTATDCIGRDLKELTVQ